MIAKDGVSFHKELVRKGIHLFSLSIPVGYALLNKDIALSILIPLAVIFIIVDILSRKNNSVRPVIHKVFGQIMRPHEFEAAFMLNGATWLVISACICIIVFPKILAVTGFAVLIISDICAALFGKKFGKTPLFDKSMEGTIAFIISAVIVVIITGAILSASWAYYLFGFLSVIVAGIAEAASHKLRVDDNLAIPVSIGLIMWGGGLLAQQWGATYLALMVN